MYHEPMDFAYAGYMAVVGELVEHVGQATGQWHYPGQPGGGVPLWLLTLWAGVGLFNAAPGPASAAATERPRTATMITPRSRRDEVALLSKSRLTLPQPVRGNPAIALKQLVRLRPYAIVTEWPTMALKFLRMLL
jgi:hypothetical protein